MGDIEIIGHRGYASRAPENTLVSIRAALLAGADAVEFDVRVARCGTPMVIHDEALDRTTDGAGDVQERTAKQLRALDAGSWFDPRFAGERIPTFEEALDLLEGTPHHLYPELKGIRHAADVNVMIHNVYDRAMADRTTFISIDWSILERIRSQDPDIGIGFIVVSADLFAPALDMAAADPAALLDLDQQIVLDDPVLAGRATEKGLKVVTWTVNETDDASRLLAAGVTSFTTNHVERLLAWAAREG